MCGVITDGTESSVKHLATLFVTPATTPQPWRWLTPVVLFALVAVMSLLLLGNLPYRTNYEVHDEDLHTRNLFFQNNYSYIEPSALGDFRWIVKKAPDTYTYLTYVMDTPLVHTVASLHERLGGRAYAAFTVVLFSENTKQISITGQGAEFAVNLLPGKRNYTFLVPGEFLVPYGRWPMRDMHFARYGISSEVLEANMPGTGDNRELVVAYFGATMHHFAGTIMTLWIVLLASVPAIIAIAMARTQHPYLSIVLYLLWVMRWIYEYVFQLPFSSEPVVYALVTGGAYAVLQRMARAGYITGITSSNTIVLAAMSTLFYQFNVLPVAFWRNGVGFDIMPLLPDFVRFLGEMRVPMPIPLLSLEYALYRIHNPLLFDIVYMTIMPRILFMVGLYYATDELTTVWRHGNAVRYVSLLVFAASIPTIVLYQRQNFIFMYDAIIGVCLVLILKLAARPQWTRQEVLVLASAIVVADMMRPFMFVITPILVVWIGMRIYQRNTIRDLYLFLAPMSILVIWHAYHIIVLHQLTWSNYSGYNLARAWYPEAMTQTPPIPKGTGINDVIWSTNSSIVMRNILAWMAANPVDALLKVPWLLWQTYQVPITIARVHITGTIELHNRTLEWYALAYTFVYRIIFAIALWGLAVETIRRLVRFRTLVMRASIVTLIVVVVALSENGEQSRFLLSLAPAVLYAFIHLWLPRTELTADTQSSAVVPTKEQP